MLEDICCNCQWKRVRTGVRFHLEPSCSLLNRKDCDIEESSCSQASCCEIQYHAELIWNTLLTLGQKGMTHLPPSRSFLADIPNATIGCAALWISFSSVGHLREWLALGSLRGLLKCSWNSLRWCEQFWLSQVPCPHLALSLET